MSLIQASRLRHPFPNQGGKEAGVKGKRGGKASSRWCLVYAGAAASPGLERDGSNLVGGIKGGREVQGVLRQQPASSESFRIPR